MNTVFDIFGNTIEIGGYAGTIKNIDKKKVLVFGKVININDCGNVRIKVIGCKGPSDINTTKIKSSYIIKSVNNLFSMDVKEAHFYDEVD